MILEEPLNECLNLRNTAAAAIYLFVILSGHSSLPEAEGKRESLKLEVKGWNL